MTTFLRGSNLGVFAPEKDVISGSTGSGYTLIACETDCTLNVNVNSLEISSKCSGKWGDSIPDTVNWSIDCSYLYCNRVDVLMKACIDRKTMKVRFSSAKNTDSGNTTVITEDHTPETGGDSFCWYEGDVYISSMRLAGSQGSNSSFTVTLTGKGILKQVTPTTPASE